MTKTVYRFTQEGFDKLKEELDAIQKRRPQVVINLSNAREQGDLSENAGYHAAKDELSQIDSRIKELKYLLRAGRVVESQNKEVVEFGCKVVVNSHGQEMEFTIVEEMEAEPLKGKISTSSPIGKALMGKKAGDIAEIEAPVGKVVYKIIKIY